VTPPDDAVARYLRALDRLGAVVDAVPAERWDAPTPCSGWSARRLVGHLVDGQGQVSATVTGQGQVLAMLAAEGPGRRCPTRTHSACSPARTTPAPGEAPTRRPSRRCALSHPAPECPPRWARGPSSSSSASPSSSPSSTPGPGDGDRPADLDPDAVRALLPGVLALGGRLQATGRYAPPVAVPDDAPAQDRLLAALGRRPLG
jgi:hypothetical protein